MGVSQVKVLVLSSLPLVAVEFHGVDYYDYHYLLRVLSDIKRRYCVSIVD